jgi:hypothetical protein
MKTLILALVLSMAAGAQTEVRHAIVLPSYKDLKYPPLPPLKVPDPTEITLSNGMKVLLLEDHELPLISGAALIRTGNLFDPPDKRGLAGLTGEVRAAKSRAVTTIPAASQNANSAISFTAATRRMAGPSSTPISTTSSATTCSASTIAITSPPISRWKSSATFQLPT